MKAANLAFLILGLVVLAALVILIFVVLFHEPSASKEWRLPVVRYVPSVLNPTNPWPSTTDLPVPQFAPYDVPFPQSMREKDGSLANPGHYLTVHWNGWRRTGYVGMFEPNDSQHDHMTNYDLVFLPLVATNERSLIQFGYPNMFQNLVKEHKSLPSVLLCGDSEGQDQGLDVIAGLISNREFKKDTLHFYMGYRYFLNDAETPAGYMLSHQESLPDTLDCHANFTAAHLWAEDNYMEGEDLILFAVPQDTNFRAAGQNVRVYKIEVNDEGRPSVTLKGDIHLPRRNRIIRVMARHNQVMVFTFDTNIHDHRLYQFRYMGPDVMLIKNGEITVPENNNGVCEHNTMFLSPTRMVVGNGAHAIRVYRRKNTNSFDWYKLQDLSFPVDETVLDVHVSEGGQLMAAITENDIQLAVYVWRWSTSNVSYLMNSSEPFVYREDKPTSFHLHQHSVTVHLSLDHRRANVLFLVEDGMRVLQWDF